MAALLPLASSVLGPCRICDAPMRAHAMGGIWIGCPPVSPVLVRPNLDLLALDLTFRALDRRQPPAETEPLSQVASELRAASQHSYSRLSSDHLEQPFARARR